MSNRGTIMHLAAMDLRSWLSGNRLLYLIIAGMAGVFIGPFFISFTFGSDQIIYADVVVSSVWLLSIGGGIVLGSSSAAEDLESQRFALLRVAGLSNGSLIAEKLAVMAMADLVLWCGATSVALLVVGEGALPKVFGISGGVLMLFLVGMPWVGRWNAPILAGGALLVGVGNVVVLFGPWVPEAARAICLVLPVSLALSSIAVLAGLNLRLPAAVSASVAVWIILFVVQGYAAGGGVLEAFWAGVPVIELPPEVWGAMPLGVLATVLSAFLLSAVCIMGLVWVWGTWSTGRRDS